jgi:hypothetical protein
LLQEYRNRYLGGMLTCYVEYVPLLINWNRMMEQETARLCHRLGFVSVLTHGQQLDIDILKVYNASALLVHHMITIQK